ncbi:nitroreductase family protein [Roseimaritima sediminicola]|uniref:nitroreductase family protein n=1 Tax=Roseimaritima sediminicola TaxID=2662066 RepID=UPI0012982DCC|nr:nitroreductase family protein [Roseimaritima sediminicola]
MPNAKPDHPIIDAMTRRWSPYAFTPRTVERDKVLQCFEAARWAASSFNEQPWSFLLAFREQEAEFQRMLACLSEGNQQWAGNVGVLILTVTREHFQRNDKPNRVAQHDLGAAAAHFALQAAELGLQAHQMAGVELEKVRSTYQIPDGYQPQTAIALGYPDPDPPAGKLAERDAGPRERRPIEEQVFHGRWQQPAF